MATTNEQPPAQIEETPQTPAVKDEESKEETFTKAQLTELIQKEIGKVTAKHSKKIEALQTELEAEKRKQLPDPEKFKADLEDREKKIAEANAKLAALEAKEKKRAALDAVKLTLPSEVSVSDLLDMMPGNDDESIAAYIEKFKKMFPESKSLGSPTSQGAKPKATLTATERLAELQQKSKDPKLSDGERLTLAREIISVNNSMFLEKK